MSTTFVDPLDEKHKNKLTIQWHFAWNLFIAFET